MKDSEKVAYWAAKAIRAERELSVLKAHIRYLATKFPVGIPTNQLLEDMKADSIRRMIKQRRYPS